MDPTSGLADAFDPNANSTVQSVALLADGKILAGGGFTDIGGQSRGRLARLDATTGLADSFDPGAGAFISSIHVQPDGRILVAGGFTTMSTQPRGRVARFSTRPPLKIQANAGTNIVLSWPTNFAGFTLEENANLATNGWSTALPAPVVSGSNNVVTNVASGPARFYRLRQ